MKTLLWAILALVILVGIGIGVFVATFDPNSYRELLGDTVKQTTGRKLSIAGDLSLAVWPKIALRAEQLSLANPEGYGPEPMLTAKALEATIAVAPLLQREVNIDGVVLYSPVITLRESGPDQNNWSDLQARFTEDAADPRAESAQGAETEVQLNLVTLENALISLQTPDEELSVSALNLELGFPTKTELSLTASGRLQTDSNAEPAEFAASTNITLGEAQTLLQQTQLTWALSASEQLELSIPRVELSADQQQAQIEEGRVTLADSVLNFSAALSDLLTTPRFEANVTTAGANTQALLKLAALELPDNVPANRLGKLDGQAKLSGALAGDDRGAIRVHNFSAALSGLALSATGHMDLDPSGAARGKLELAPMDLASLASTLPDLLDPELFQPQSNKPTLQTLRSDFDWVPAKPSGVATLNFSNTQLQVLGLTAQLNGKTRLTDPTVTTTTAVTLEEFSPRQLLTYFSDELATEDPGALGSASGTLTLQQDATGTHLRDLKVNIDDSQLRGEISMLEGAIPTLRFDTSLNRLNASNYLEPTDNSATASASADDVLGDLVLPTELLHAYDLDGSFRINQLQLFDLQMGDAGAQIILGNGNAALNNLSARLYGGTFIGKVGFRELADTPELAITGDLQQVDIASLVDAASSTHDFTGRGNVQINMTGRGTTALAAVQSAAGTFGMQLEQGTYTGINIGHELCKLYNLLRNEPAPPATDDPATRFDTFSATATVTNGLAQTNDLLASNGYMKISGSGSSQLAKQSINYDIDIELVGPIEAENCETLTPYIGSRIPVRVTGDLSNPKLRPDFGKLAKREIKRRVEEKVTEKITEKLFDIFGRKKAETETETPEGSN